MNVGADPKAARRVHGVVGAAFAVCAAGIVLLATRHGITVEQDGSTYISAARNLTSGRGLRDFTGERLTIFPPLLPALIAGGIKLGMTATTTARVINAVGYATLVVLFWILVRRHVQSMVIALAAVAVITFSHGLVRIYDKVWSEPVFLVLLLAGLLVLEDALRAEGRRAMRLFAASGALFGVSYLARYAGIALVVAGVVTILFSLRRSTVRDVMTRVAVFALAWAWIPALWLAHNALSNAPLMGPRVGSGWSPFSTLRQLALGVGAIFLPESAPKSLAYIVSALVLALVVVGIWLVFRHEDDPGRGEGSYSLLPIVVLPVVYSGFVCFAHWNAGTSTDARIMVPVYLSAVVIGAVVLDELRVRVWDDLAGRAKTTILVILGGVLFIVCVATVGNAAQIGRTAHVYAVPALRATPMATAVRQLPSDALVATNDPYKLYFMDVVDRLEDGTLYKVPGADC